MHLFGDRMKMSLPKKKKKIFFFFFFRETPTSPWVPFRTKFRPLGRLYRPSRPLAWSLKQINTSNLDQWDCSLGSSRVSDLGPYCLQYRVSKNVSNQKSRRFKSWVAKKKVKSDQVVFYNSDFDHLIEAVWVPHHMFCLRTKKNFFISHSYLEVCSKKIIGASACDFQQFDILTSVDSDEPLQPPFKLRNSKWRSVSSLTIIEYSSDKQRLWSDCAYAQADLRLCWSHKPNCWKSHALAQYYFTYY